VRVCCAVQGMLINITGGSDMTLHEVDIAAQRVTEEVEDERSAIIFGSSFDHNLEGSIRVSVVATGIEDVDHTSSSSSSPGGSDRRK
jgi:cell division protein FtsZ